MEGSELLNREIGVTVILTAHDMSDIESLCSRIIIIDNKIIISMKEHQ